MLVLATPRQAHALNPAQEPDWPGGAGWSDDRRHRGDRRDGRPVDRARRDRAHERDTRSDRGGGRPSVPGGQTKRCREAYRRCITCRATESVRGCQAGGELAEWTRHGNRPGEDASTAGHGHCANRRPAGYAASSRVVSAAASGCHVRRRDNQHPRLKDLGEGDRHAAHESHEYAAANANPWQRRWHPDDVGRLGPRHGATNSHRRGGRRSNRCLNPRRRDDSCRLPDSGADRSQPAK